LFQSGTGSTAKLGINTTTPATTLDVKGSGTIRGALSISGAASLPATGAATPSSGRISQPLNLAASAFNSGTSQPVNQTFQFQAEPIGNDTTTPSGTLNLLFGSGTSKPTETGLHIASNGQITFASGQTFPGAGAGTVTSVGLSAPSSDFTVSGSPITGSGTLGLTWTVAPTSADTANAIVKRDGSGNFSAGTISANGLYSGSLTLNSYLSLIGDAYVYSTGGGSTIWGVAAGSGDVVGVEGDTYSSGPNAYGVYGEAGSSSGNPIGVYGQASSSATGIGVFGQQASESVTGASMSGNPAGVWGDAGGTPLGLLIPTGVIGTADNGTGGNFLNSSDQYPTLNVLALNDSYLLTAYNNLNNTYCDIDDQGDLLCSGSTLDVVPMDGGKRAVALPGIGSPKNWFEDFGSAQLVNGAAVVALDADFTQTVNTSQEYQVFLTPYGDCKGLYVSNRTANSFEVHELGGGSASLSFGYRIAALRRNYENVRFADHTHDLDSMKQMRERMKMNHARQQSHDPVKKVAPALHAVATASPVAP
jgi:hypothetical protein